MIDTLPPPRPPGRTANLYLPAETLARVDRLAKRRGEKRSPCVAVLLEWALDRIDGKTGKAKP